MSRNESFLRRLFAWRLFFVVNLVFILFIAVTLGREFLKTREIQKEIDALRAQAEDLATKNISMSELQTAIQTQSFIEREARLKLGMKKPGENVVIVTEGNPASETMDPRQENTSDPLGFVLDGEEKQVVENTTKWWVYFFDRKTFHEWQSYENREGR